jgi:hypothetical protein
VLGLLFVGALAACAGQATEDEAASGAAISGPDDDPLAPEVDDAISQLPWEAVGTGVSYKAFAGGGSDIVIVYGGYLADATWVQRWADEIDRALGTALAIGHLYSIQGPNTAGYTNGEIGNSKLAAHLATNGRAAGASHIAVLAHSSGTYVADELLHQLENGTGGAPADTLGKIHLFNLDGGGVSDSALLHKLARAYFVWGCDHTIDRCSHNSDGMKSLGQTYASLGGGVEVRADGSGCDKNASGGLWCLHDTLINSNPHNPTMYDLKRDYTDFAAPRHLMTSYLAPLTGDPPTASN